MSNLNNDEGTYNPMAHDTIENMLEKRKEAERQKALLEEEVEEWKKCLERFCNSTDGKFIMKKMIKYIGLFSFDTKIDAGRLVEQAALKRLYIELFRTFISKTTRMEIENQ